MAKILVAVFQIAPRGSKEETLRAVEEAAARIRVSPDIALFPEYLMFDPTGMSREEAYRLGEALDGPWVGGFSRLAEKLGSCMAFHMFERSSSGRVYGSLVLLRRDGSIADVYRKTHLFDAYSYRESSFTEPGNRLLDPLDLCGARVGAAICYELRFPEVFRYTALRGAEAMLVPAAWYRGPGKEETLRVLAQARAHENGFYVVVAGNPGPNFVGGSRIVNPWGHVEVDAGWGEKVLLWEIDTGEVARARETIPQLRHLRRDLYPVPWPEEAVQGSRGG